MISSSYERLQIALADKKDADYRISRERDYLKAKIPPGSAMDQVQHLVHEREVINYSDAISEIINTLVPKGRRVMAWYCVGRHTRKDICHSFERNLE